MLPVALPPKPVGSLSADVDGPSEFAMGPTSVRPGLPGLAEAFFPEHAMDGTLNPKP